MAKRAFFVAAAFFAVLAPRSGWAGHCMYGYDCVAPANKAQCENSNGVYADGDCPKGATKPVLTPKPGGAPPAANVSTQPKTAPKTAPNTLAPTKAAPAKLAPASKAKPKKMP